MATSSTPPNHPVHGVRVTDDQIQAIVALAFPGYESLEIEQLPSQTSFNNRIYFLDIQLEGTAKDACIRHVLKVPGKFFGARKVQNEAGSLLLLAQHCPHVPAPRVVAWPGDGNVVHVVSSGRKTLSHEADEQVSKTGSESTNDDRAWLLLTYLPGRIIGLEDLDGEYGPALLKELAQHVADWRSHLPTVHCYGNVRYMKSSDGLPNFDFGAHVPKFTVGGQNLCNQYSPASYSSAASFHSYMAQSKFNDLISNKLLAPLRAQTEQAVSKWISNLPNMRIFRNRDEAAAFTHMDLAPRNVLISDEHPPRLTGILDWEWAHFAPVETEFLNMVVGQPDDWTERHRRILLQEISKLVPIPDLESTDFVEASAVTRIIDGIAPWYINSESMSEETIGAECDKAAQTVLEGIRELESS